jgi:ABC-type transporter Mla subunit MlaD
MNDDTPTTPTETLDPGSTEALYLDALAETTTTESDAVRKLFRSRILEVRRLQDLLARAEDDLRTLRSKTPREIAAMAGASSGSYGELIHAKNATVRFLDQG